MMERDWSWQVLGVTHGITAWDVLCINILVCKLKRLRIPQGIVILRLIHKMCCIKGSSDWTDMGWGGPAELS